MVNSQGQPPATDNRNEQVTTIIYNLDFSQLSVGDSVEMVVVDGKQAWKVTTNKQEKECPECGGEMERNEDGEWECDDCDHVENSNPEGHNQYSGRSASEIKKDIKEHRQGMKEAGHKETSFMNGGQSTGQQKANEKLFALKTELVSKCPDCHDDVDEDGECESCGKKVTGNTVKVHGSLKQLIGNFDESLEDRKTELQGQLAKRFGSDSDLKSVSMDGSNVWISDLYDDRVIYQKGSDLFSLPYEEEDGECVLSDEEPKPVKRRTTYEPVDNSLWLTWNRSWPQSKRDKLDDSDFAGPDQSFPIVTQADVDSAAKLIGKAESPEAIKKNIKAIADRKGLDLPEAWRGNMQTNSNPEGHNQYSGGSAAHEASKKAYEASKKASETKKGKSGERFGEAKGTSAKEVAHGEAAKAHFAAASEHLKAIDSHSEPVSEGSNRWQTKPGHEEAVAAHSEASKAHMAAAQVHAKASGKSTSRFSTNVEWINNMLTNENPGPYSPGQFAMMDKHAEADKATKSANRTTKAANKGTKGHMEAAKAHKDAAAAHTEAGNKGAAEHHTKMASRHKMARQGDTVTTNTRTEEPVKINREQAIAKLTANCSRDADKAALNQMSDETLMAIATVNAKKKKNPFQTEEEDEDDSSEEGSSMESNDDKNLHSFDQSVAGKTSTPGKSIQAGSDGKRDDYNTNRRSPITNRLSPQELEVWNHAQSLVTNQKKAIVEQLIVNLTDNAERNRIGNKLMRESMPELQDRLKLMPPTENRRQAVYVGDAPAFNGQQDAADANDVLETPTINMQELAEEIRTRGRGKVVASAN